MFWEYDTRLARRWNIDPVYKHHLSNYTAFSNNPIWHIDPLGNDDYKVNKKGQIKLVGGTKDEKDKLIAVKGKNGPIEYDEKGNLINNFIELEKDILSKKQLLEEKDVKGKTRKGSKLDFGENKELADKTFKFLADNTQVEWGLVTFGTEGKHNSSLYTSESYTKEYFSANRVRTLGYAGPQLKILKHYHNHPRGSWADNAYGAPSPADLSLKNKVIGNNSNAEFYIYELKEMYEY